MAIQIRTSLAEPETGDTFVPHRPARPDKAEGGKRFEIVSEYELPIGAIPVGVVQRVGSHGDLDGGTVVVE